VGVDVRKTHDGGVEICVWDYGHGFEPATLQRAQRLADGVERMTLDNMGNLDGIGLGLRIVAQVVQRHRGKLNILSEPTLGTFAYIKLPYRNSPQVAANDLDAPDRSMRSSTAMAS
jgi:two-component system phosphate regulon sensor histidine kinase PhoR